ncbi:MAG: DNA photolyase [Desulfocapsa sp.]|nr:DNA photolyase [Desulfocapsa sp.]
MKKAHSWKDPSIYVTDIHVEESCMDLEYTQQILERAKLSLTVIPDREDPEGIEGEYPDNLIQGKHHLLLGKNRGHFFKPCPGTREYRCCDYQVLNIGMGCPMDCVYCILQAYLNKPWLTFFVNTDDLLAEMTNAFKKEPDRFFRIGTGEFTDSMALDRITCLSPLLVEFMAKQKQAVLELKTKSAVIDNLEHLDHNGRTILAWSLNSTQIMKKEEIRTATLEERLAAAAQCAKWGYKLAFHFDPIIDHPGWEEGYRETITRLYQVVPADKIVWISLGALRYLPSLKTIGTNRFPQSRIFYQEFIEGLDNKKRYFRPRRVTLYNHIYSLLKKYASPETCIYFCMESDEIWKDVMGFTPEERGGIPLMLDRTVNGSS